MTGEGSKPADNWDDDPLSRFMETASTRLHETQGRLRASWVRLTDIDKAFSRICENLNEPGDILAAALLIRSHSAYRAGVRLAASGQVPESYMVFRGCLEFGLHALFMSDDPERQKRWMTRSDTPENRKRFRDEFTAGAMLRFAGGRSGRIARVARTLYEHLIDFGAHPNDLGLGATSSLSESEEHYRLDTSYIVGDGVLARGALKTAARVGICALWLFGLVFKERFSILGLDSELERVSQGL